MNVQLSVIIPVYNGEKYIAETMKSVLESSFIDLELIIIDDGSTDQSAGIISELMKEEMRIHYYFQENAGIVAARNRGLCLARGKYVCFCDQDDIVAKDMYEILISKMEASNADVSMCSTGRLINEKISAYETLMDGCYRKQEIKQELLYPLLFRGYEVNFVSKNHYLYGTIWKCIFNRQFLLDCNMQFHRFISYEDDWLFVTEALAKARCVVTSKYTGYYWRILKSSESHAKHTIDDLSDRLDQYDKYVDCYLKPIMSSKEYDLYQAVRAWEHILEIMTNDWYKGRDCRSFTKIRSMIGKYENSSPASVVSYVQKNSYRRRWTFFAFYKFGLKIGYYMNGFILLLEEKMTYMSCIVKWERKKKFG